MAGVHGLRRLVAVGLLAGRLGGLGEVARHGEEALARALAREKHVRSLDGEGAALATTRAPGEAEDAEAARRCGRKKGLGVVGWG